MFLKDLNVDIWLHVIYLIEQNVQVSSSNVKHSQYFAQNKLCFIKI